MNVLVAEDDDVTRLLLNSALSKLGHKVSEATDGGGAWEAWQREHFSLVISDWMMPDVDGLELCRRIRLNERSDFTYLILLTARTGKANYLGAMEAGVDDFITKPFEKDQFLARVQVATRILEMHEKLRLAIPIWSVGCGSERSNSRKRSRRKANCFRAPATSCAPR
jgi:two-component system cell cycle response regulator